eukprot:TRINITY_DN19081_c0_g1_i2.p1 TRINITY_DN19081_c0_g1~~TRINITY_DN19081_c0_g1_i2.p1  ORF type:complete len:243 (+),score=107.03 TRINITY_DN19081_c0_g1_i2:106-834(+)
MTHSVYSVRKEKKREKKRRPAWQDILEGVGQVVSALPLAVVGWAAYGILVLVLVTSWYGVYSESAAVHHEVAMLQGNAKLRELEKVELSKKLLDRVNDDYHYILEEVEHALEMDNVTKRGGSAFAYSLLLPELFAGLQLINNITRLCKEDPLHTILLKLASNNPSGIGGPEWGFKRDEQIRASLGPPLRLTQETDAIPDTNWIPSFHTPDLNIPIKTSSFSFAHLRYVLIVVLVVVLVARAA